MVAKYFHNYEVEKGKKYHKKKPQRGGVENTVIGLKFLI